jgi:CheY-like chemotaxis protein
VSDTGSGMDAEVLSHVFEPFFTTKGPGKGTGLGLATTYGIVKQHGGNIWVYSEPGIGTTFKIYLPVVQEGTDQATPAPLEEMSGMGSETVLLVEDDEMVRGLMEAILVRYGYTVIAAEDAGAAVRKAERPGPVPASIPLPPRHEGLVCVRLHRGHRCSAVHDRGRTAFSPQALFSDRARQQGEGGVGWGVGSINCGFRSIPIADWRLRIAE